jgi:hypothetical protein
MAGSDTLPLLGAKITEVFTRAFTSSSADATVVFLPFALTPPAGVVQQKSATDATLVVNAAQMAAFLAQNFDEPYLFSTDASEAHGKDGYYGRLSQIYPLAVTLAQPTAEAGSSAWKVVNAELAMAQSVLTPAGMAYAMSASPEDWVLPGNATYWSTFDSAQTQAPATSNGGPTPAPRLWLYKAAESQIASPILESLHAANPPQRAPDLPVAKTAPILAREEEVVRPALALAPTASSPAVTLAGSPAISPDQRTPASATLAKATLSGSIAKALPPSGVTPVRRIPIDIVVGRLPPAPAAAPQSAPPPAPPPAPATSSLAMHFEYMSVAIGYLNAGISMWNGVFLANPNWCVPGMTKGGLLPSPAPGSSDGQPTLSYGMPVALIIVRNLKVSAAWSGQDQATLQAAGGYIGPFSLAGATSAALPDGSCTYAQPGMQVVALLCTRLPVLPPQDGPDVVTAAMAGDSSQAGARVGASDETATGAAGAASPTPS